MTDYVLLQRYIMLKNLLFMFFFCFSEFLSMACASDPVRVILPADERANRRVMETAYRGPINIVYADDMPVNLTGMRGAVTRYNKSKEKLGDISAVYHAHGTKVRARHLIKINLLMLDISMPGQGEIDGVLQYGDGYPTLQRLQAEALLEGIILPPCIAVTTEEYYLTVPNYATDRGFLFAHDKILPGPAGVPSVFARCAELLGERWLTTHCGRRATTPIWEVNQTTFSASEPLRRSGNPRRSMRERWNSWRGQSKRAPRLSASALTHPRKEGHPFEEPSSAPDDATVPSSMRSAAPKVPPNPTPMPSIGDEIEELTSEGEGASAVVGVAKVFNDHMHVSSISSARSEALELPSADATVNVVAQPPIAKETTIVGLPTAAPLTDAALDATLVRPARWGWLGRVGKKIQRLWT